MADTTYYRTQPQKQQWTNFSNSSTEHGKILQTDKGFILPEWLNVGDTYRERAVARIDAFISMGSTFFQGFAVRFEAIQLYSKLISGDVKTEELSQEIDILLCKHLILLEKDHLQGAWDGVERTELLRKCNLEALDNLVHSRCGGLELSKEVLEAYYTGTDTVSRGAHIGTVALRNGSLYARRTALNLREAASNTALVARRGVSVLSNGTQSVVKFIAENPQMFEAIIRTTGALADVSQSRGSNTTNVYVNSNSSSSNDTRYATPADPLEYKFFDLQKNRKSLLAAGKSTREIDLEIEKINAEMEKEKKAVEKASSSFKVMDYSEIMTQGVIGAVGVGMVATAHNAQQKSNRLYSSVSEVQKAKGTAADALMPGNAFGHTHVAKEYLDFLVTELTFYLNEKMGLGYDDEAMKFVESMKFDLKDGISALDELRIKREEFVKKQHVKDTKANYSWMLTGLGVTAAALVPKKFRWIPASIASTAAVSAAWFSVTGNADTEERKEMMGLAAMELEKYTVKANPMQKGDYKADMLDYINTLASDFQGDLEDQSDSIMSVVGRNEVTAKNMLLESLRLQAGNRKHRTREELPKVVKRAPVDMSTFPQVPTGGISPGHTTTTRAIPYKYDQGQEYA
ncbi:hypothetical protein AB751O23_AB_00300 [Chlamydiales bacterium SCGC AB-751-O23]|nr:hypothetical protein AB751O23_AB_00300 [Chlamydiales bacterium SCGC AB-751-O23]